MQMNRIEIAGYLAARASLRFLGSGTRVANARIGESHRYKTGDNQQVTQTNWHNLTFYNSLADQAMKYEKGTNLFIEGTVQQRKFTPKDGSERTVHEVIVQSCHAIGIAPAGEAKTDGAAELPPAEDRDNDDAPEKWPL